ncbi:hypothetical protein PC129_g18146 [Phytophthora cactorum]|uniref:Telomerase reverse transcriptase n=1 Tax=Phytophthora cactorum TaxID=29920 RepID=A0A329S0H6_9STRA|nr:hypothetical protein Pcac1_g26490 [Phytophthora cactorum]KAG2802781.1 hypothetical protein PC112_g19481 [Phytophthora cactorum]KAG2803628.1 hypothetical protein PC111_g18606 [Phytophthora cactorum]KAG2839916.1 hypothetical protein PC113_g19366 [Phytophthora cactorum]KAG2882052.1 hypothetical protein PC114_g21225 [Phytophthora cactorum]
MEALLAKASTLRSFLRSTSEERLASGDATLEQNLSSVTNQDVLFALDHTFIIQSHTTGVDALPRSPWSCETCISHTELVHHVIERLLARKRAINWEDANVLTLGYREVTPGAVGHRVTQSNGIICYYPNTLVAALKKPLWGSLHELMGDDLMTHLLLNYTILVQLKENPDSYMQLTGRSLRQQNRLALNSSVDSTKREVSINYVMYARCFRRDRVFTSSHVLGKAAKTGDLISRTEASRVIRSIFPNTASEKRLPKRLIHLIPTIQKMVSRFKACQVEELATKLVPVNADFRKFMADNASIKRKMAERTADAKTSSQPVIQPILRKALEDGYLSQSEDIAPSSDRKRKRREEAIELLSHASTRSSKNSPEEAVRMDKKHKKSDTSSGKERNVHEVSDLTKLQHHKEDIKKMLAFATPKKKIFRLIRRFIAEVVPKELWGSSDTKTNWKCVKMLLRKLIFSRKFVVFSLKKCAEEFQVTKVEWMNVQSKGKYCPPNERVKRLELLEDLLWWVMSFLVFPLLRNLFYITEAEGMANEIAYYQRPVWNVISTLALSDLEGGILQPSSIQTLPSDRQLATSRMRLLPKSSGVRPLMNLSTAIDQAKVSVNRSMEAVHRVLTFEVERQPKLLGASVRNIDEIYMRLKPLFRQISQCPRCAERRCLSGDNPMAYCVTVDVERCFDTIRPRKLYQMLKKALTEDEYLIRKHWVGHQVAPISSSTDSGESLPASSFFFKLERPACPSGDLLGFDELAAQSTKKNSMFVDGVLYDYLTKTKALQLLKEHLSANIVQMEGREYVQRCGIPQGSVLSTTLCNMYYAHFERRVLRKRLPEVCDPAIVPVSCCQHEELFRYTDDFMYITTDLKRARKFFEVMHEGNDEYGCFVNVTKTQANFEVKSGGKQAADASKDCISWCGMLIDPTHLQVYVNYEKLGSSLLQGSIPFNETKPAQDFFVNKVISPIRQRWHALYFDPELLSEDSIHVNLFQMLVVAAHRFTILIEMLPFVNRDMLFFHCCILRILKKMTKGIHHSLELGLESGKSRAEFGNRSSKLTYEAQKDQVWTTGLYAFQLAIEAKRDQDKGSDAGHIKPKCQWADWQKLLDAVQAEQEEFNKRAKRTQGTTALNLEWFLQDRRNMCVLKQFLQRRSA